VPISSCRCGLPSANASWELAPAQVVQLSCHNWYARLARGFGWEVWVAGWGYALCWVV
jgi:hypothetical protein